jgi:hypothetical protein
MGSGIIRAVSIVNPSMPISQGSYNVAPGIEETSIYMLRARLDTAIQNLDKFERREAFLSHSFRAAQDAHINLEQYEGFIVVVHGPFLRGGNLGNLGSLDPYQGINITFMRDKGLIYLAYGASWSRRAQEVPCGSLEEAVDALAAAKAT